MVLACKDYIQQCTLIGDDDKLWEKVHAEILDRDGDHAEPHHRALARQIESRLRVCVLLRACVGVLLSTWVHAGKIGEILQSWIIH